MCEYHVTHFSDELHLVLDLFARFRVLTRQSEEGEEWRREVENGQLLQVRSLKAGRSHLLRDMFYWGERAD